MELQSDSKKVAHMGLKDINNLHPKVLLSVTPEYL